MFQGESKILLLQVIVESVTSFHTDFVRQVWTCPISCFSVGEYSGRVLSAAAAPPRERPAHDARVRVVAETEPDHLLARLRRSTRVHRFVLKIHLT